MKHTLEIATYRVGSADFDSVHRQTHDTLAGFDGYLTSLALRGLEDPLARADLVMWASADGAHEASEVFKTDDRLAEFRESLQEMLHFGHYSGPAVDDVKALGRASVVEVAIYPTKPEFRVSQRDEIYAGLTKLKLAQPVMGGYGLENDAVRYDLLGLTSKARHEAAPGELMAAGYPAEAFFATMETPLVFSLFESVAG